MRLVVAVAVDLVLIVVFALLGRRTHDEGTALAGTLTVAAPFLIGYAIAAVAWRLDRGPVRIARGAAVAGTSVAIGLLLRGTAFDRGLAPAFVVVAFITITALLVGWRLVVRRLDGRVRDPATTS